MASDYRFQVPVTGTTISWDRALFLNLTFWNGAEGADVLCDEHIAADVVAYVVWHYVVGRQLDSAGSPAALFLAEAIASAFDLYLGRPDADECPSNRISSPARCR